MSTSIEVAIRRVEERFALFQGYIERMADVVAAARSVCAERQGPATELEARLIAALAALDAGDESS